MFGLYRVPCSFISNAYFPKLSGNLQQITNFMQSAIPLSQNQFMLQAKRIDPENLENAAIRAKHRALEACQIKKSQSLYDIGGWKSLFEQYMSQPLDPSTTSDICLESVTCKERETKDGSVTNLSTPMKTYVPKDHSKSLSQSSSDCSQDASMQQVAGSATLPLCPSTQPEMDHSVVFGVVGGTVEAPWIAYLTESVAVTEDILALSAPVKPTEIFRMASSCVGDACKHFDGAHCRLAMRIVQQLPTVVEALPACQIRPSCRWWQQEGKAACFRCPQMVTDNYYSSEILQQVAAPNS